MSEVYQDTPNYYSTSTQDRFWDDVHADAEVTADAGRFGSGDDAWTGTSESAYRLKYMRQSAGHDQFAIGRKINIDAYPAANKVIFAVTDAAGSMQMSCVLKTSGKLAIFRGSAAGTELRESVAAVATSTYLDLGFKGTISAAVGEGEIWVGESGDNTTWAVVARVNGANTQGVSGVSDWMGVYLGETDQTQSCHLYVRNGSTADGGLRDLSPGHWTDVKFPSATDDLQDWTANTGTRHEAIDDADADDDTTYVEGEAVGDRFAVDAGTLAATQIVYAVDLVAVVRNYSGYSYNYSPIVVANRDDTTTRTVYVRGWRTVTDAAWAGIHECLPVNPYTSVLYTRAQVNTTAWGGELAA